MMRRFINREVSELAFVERVLEHAEEEANPLLERARYLAITGNLLDEFYRIRVAALRQQIRQRPKKRSDDGRKPSAQLKLADKLSNRLTRRQDKCWRGLRSRLHKAGIDILRAKDIHDTDLSFLRDVFDQQIRPALKLSPATREALLDEVQDGELLLIAKLADAPKSLQHREVFIDVPLDLPRFIGLPGSGFRFVPIETVIKLFFESLTEGCEVKAVALARVLREGSLKRFDDGDDLLTQVKEAIARREHADVIRLRVERSMPADLTYLLSEKLGLLEPSEIKSLERSRRKATRSEFVVSNAFLGVSDLSQLIGQLPKEFAAPLSYPEVHSRTPDFIGDFDGDLLRAIAAQDRMLHFPYDDFDVLVGMIARAATDEAVVAVRQTLYRAGQNSPIIDALLAAARNGKRVSVVVEVEAREDEQRNIEFAARLQQAGVQVSYGHKDRKVHAKLLIIDRREGEQVRRYVHASTGNYSVSSGRHYTDLCLLSAEESLTADTGRVFEFAFEGTPIGRLDRLAVSPFDLRERLAELIERETKRARAGEPAAIWMKFNKISDRKMIELLYAASGAGVEIDLIVRGICCLRAGVPGLSERIRVSSVVGRFLEHSRVVCFGNGSPLPSDSAEIFITSADLMPHKLDERVEVLVPIEDAALRRKIQRGVFLPYFNDSANTWDLGPDDGWVRRPPVGPNVQAELFERDPALHDPEPL